MGPKTHENEGLLKMKPKIKNQNTDMNLFRIACVALLIGLPIPGAEAGYGAGNGGMAVVCRDKDQNILSAELYDLWEGRENGLTIPTTSESVENQITLALNKLGRNATEGAYRLVKNNVENLKGAYKKIPSDRFLNDTGDASLPPTGIKGCHPEQVANFQSESKILVNDEIFSKMDETSQAALEIHEAIYKIARVFFQVKTSDTTRPLVALLFSTEEDRMKIHTQAAITTDSYDKQLLGKWFTGSWSYERSGKTCTLEIFPSVKKDGIYLKSSCDLGSIDLTPGVPVLLHNPQVMWWKEGVWIKGSDNFYRDGTGLCNGYYLYGLALGFEEGSPTLSYQTMCADAISRSAIEIYSVPLKKR